MPISAHLLGPEMNLDPVAGNLAAIRERIGAACARSDRDPRDVNLVGVTKTVPVERIRKGIEAGLKVLGENYVQEAVKKRAALAGLSLSWHCIGHLQTNKAKTALECFDWIETLDREALAMELNRRAEMAGIRIPVLIQVKSGAKRARAASGLTSSVPSLNLCLGLTCWMCAG